MSNKPKRPVVAQCPDGPCASKEEAGTTDVVIEVREAGVTQQAPLDPSSVTVTLTALDQSAQRQADSVTNGSAGQVLAKFNAVKNGWYRALAVRPDSSGKIESSAARNVQVSSVKPKTANDVQRVLLVLSKQGVAKFVFFDDLSEAPLVNANVIVRHPDGVERRHTTDSAGEIRVPGATGDVFTMLGLEHPSGVGVTRTTIEGEG